MIDVAALQAAHDDFLTAAKDGGFGPPPAGEWDAERLLAHVALTDAHIAATALAILAGERPGYDNRVTLDEWNLSGVVERAGGLSSMIDFLRRQGRLFCDVAAELPEPVLSVQLPVLIVSGDAVVIDEPRTLETLVAGVGRTHLPLHAQQLASLR